MGRPSWARWSVQGNLDQFGGLKTAATQTWRIRLFPCKTQTIGLVMEKSEIWKFDKLIFQNISPKWPHCQAQKRRKASSFYRQERSKPSRNWTPKLKTLISAHVHNECNKLILRRKKKNEVRKKNRQEESLPRKHFAYWTPFWRLPRDLALHSTRQMVVWFLDLVGHYCAFLNREL